MGWKTAVSVISVAFWASACSGSSASDDDDNGGDGGASASSGNGGTGGGVNGGTGGGLNGGTGGGTGGGSVGGTGGGTSGSGGGPLGPSGLPSGAYLDELTSSELHTLCAWSIPLQGPAGATQCDNNTTVSPNTVEECSSSSVEIHCTVGMVEACTLSLEGDPCRLLSTAECEAYVDCALGG